MATVALKSDYHDAYDVWLERPGGAEVCFSRIAQDSWSVHRSQMFDLFRRLGVAHPDFGPVSGFAPETRLVIYDAPFAHCGEGKILATAAEGLTRGLGEALASAYIHDFPGHSYRYFVLAGQGAWFEHWSTEDWRSNCGDGDLSPIRGPVLGMRDVEARCRVIRNPVFAIDFVGRKVDAGIELLAIDWNPAPRLAGTPAHQCLSTHFGGNAGIARALAESVLAEAARLGTPVLDNNRILLE